MAEHRSSLWARAFPSGRLFPFYAWLMIAYYPAFLATGMLATSLATARHPDESHMEFLAGIPFILVLTVLLAHLPLVAGAEGFRRTSWSSGRRRAARACLVLVGVLTIPTAFVTFIALEWLIKSIGGGELVAFSLVPALAGLALLVLDGVLLSRGTRQPRP